MRNARLCIEGLEAMINEQGIARVVRFLQEACFEKMNDNSYDSTNWHNLAKALQPAASLATGLVGGEN